MLSSCDLNHFVMKFERKHPIGWFADKKSEKNGAADAAPFCDQPSQGKIIPRQPGFNIEAFG